MEGLVMERAHLLNGRFGHGARGLGKSGARPPRAAQVLFDRHGRWRNTAMATPEATSCRHGVFASRIKRGVCHEYPYLQGIASGPPISGAERFAAPSHGEKSEK